MESIIRVPTKERVLEINKKTHPIKVCFCFTHQSRRLRQRLPSPHHHL